MNSLLDWKQDLMRGGYVNRRTGTFLSDDLIRDAQVWERVRREQRDWGGKRAALLAFRLFSELAESVVAAQAAAHVQPCGCCEGSGIFLHHLMFVQCSICAGSGRLERRQEVDR